MKLQTVNVLSISSNVPMSINSFKDDVGGNREAEKTFCNIASSISRDNGGTELNPAELGVVIEDGYFEMNNVGVYLIHSI